MLNSSPFRIRSVVLSLTLCACVTADLRHDLKSWFERVSDRGFSCDQEDSAEVSEPIFEVVSCDDQGARWDYKYQTKGSGKPKRGPFNGKSTLTVAAIPGEHTYNYGFK